MKQRGREQRLTHVDIHHHYFTLSIADSVKFAERKCKVMSVISLLSSIWEVKKP